MNERIIDTSFGSVCLKERIDEHGYTYCEVFGGDNYDDFICEVDCSIEDKEEVIYEQLDEKLYY